MKLLDQNAISGLVEDINLHKQVAGKRILIIGADGFLGGYSALALHRLGAAVTLYSRREHPILNDLGLRTYQGDLLTTPVLEVAIEGQDVVFDLAGSSGGVESNRNAPENLNKECAPHLNLLQTASQLPKPPLILFCSSRTVYGKPKKLPVDESQSLNPNSVYAVHKKTLEDYLQVFHNLYGLNYLIFRLSNPYGPFPWQMGKSYGILNQFILKGYNGEPLPIFGDGRQLRDYIFVEDAVRAFITATITPHCHNEIFNLGGPAAISMAAAADEIIAQCPDSRIEFKPWPSAHQKIETGDYVTDCSKLESALQWKPTISFTDGLSRTLSAYSLTQMSFSAPQDEGLSPPANLTSAPTNYWLNKRVLITGAGGSLGSFLSQTLLGLGAKIIAVYRTNLPATILNHPHVTPIQLDLSGPGQRIEEIFQATAPQVIYHFAAYPDGRENPDIIEARLSTNTTATLKMLQAAQLCSIDAFILGDSCKVYGNSPVPHRENSEIAPDSSYAASKFAAWALCKIFYRNHNLPVAALRPTIIYGPGQAYNLFSFLAKCVHEGQTQISLDGGQQTRDPIFIADAVRAYLLAAENIDHIKGRALPIGGNNEISVATLSQQFVDATGKPVHVQSCPQNIRSGEILRSMCDNIEAKTFIRWTPSISLTEGLSITANYLSSPPDTQTQMESNWHQKVIESITPPYQTCSHYAG